MPLRDKVTGKILHSLIEEIEESDFDWIESSADYSFNWSEEKKNEVYKIFVIGNEKEILGLVSMRDYPEEYRIHIKLIEVGSSNVGQGKRIENIAGSLIAFACKIAFGRGYFGFVSLQPKTRLIKLYQDKYGFRQYGRLLAVEQISSRTLISKYLDHENQ